MAIGIEDLLLEIPDLTELQKKILVARYTSVIKQYDYRVSNISMLFNTMRFLVTVGSLVVPALLSIQTPGQTNTRWVSPEAVYWSSWTISLAVTMSNGILTLFKVDKKYYSLNTVLEHLKSEGWQYLELTGRYSGHYGDHHSKPNHKNQFVFFTNMIERIVMRQVEDEFYKLDDSVATNKGKVVPNNAGTEIGDSSRESRIPVASSIHPPSPADVALMATPPKDSAVKDTVVVFDSPPENRDSLWKNNSVAEQGSVEQAGTNVQERVVMESQSSSVPYTLTTSQVQPQDPSHPTTQANGQMTQQSNAATTAILTL